MKEEEEEEEEEEADNDIYSANELWQWTDDLEKKQSDGLMMTDRRTDDSLTDRLIG